MRKLYLLFILLFTFAQISFGQDAWINELHYLNNGSDLNEFIEIAVQDNILDISLLTVTLYKAANGKLDDAIIISQLCYLQEVVPIIFLFIHGTPLVLVIKWVYA